MLARLIALAAAVALTTAPAALADGDPASDVLPAQDAFYPYSPPVSKPLVTALDKLLKDVRKAGYPMKIALIETAGDLGSYPQLFNDPQRYTDLLYSELPVNQHGKVTEEIHLLVVMPAGFGGKNLGERVDEALAPVKIDIESQSDGLARAALEAVARIATVNGHETDVPAEASASGEDGGDGASPVIFIVIGGVLVGLAVVVFLVRRRRSDARPLSEPEAQASGEDARNP